jgi:hypothetical protein
MNTNYPSRSLIVTILLFMGMIACAPVQAQSQVASSSIDSGFPGKVGPFLTNQLYLPEAVSYFEAGFNPATLDVAIAYQSPPHLAADFGSFNLRNDFDLRWGITSLVGSTKRGAWRLSNISLGSTKASYASIAPYQAQVDGEGLELAYAYRAISKPHSALTVGAAWSPYNTLRTNLYEAGASGKLAATGKISTTHQGRLGLLWQNNRGTRVGLAGSYERFNQHSRIIGPSGSADTVTQGVLDQEMVVIGVSHEFASGTTIYANHLEFWLHGEGFSVHDRDNSFGISQKVGKRWIVGLTQTGKGTTASVVYLGNGWSAYVAQGNKNFSHTEGILGERGSFTGAGVSINLR